jgi:hypothetical protein
VQGDVVIQEVKPDPIAPRTIYDFVKFHIFFSVPSVADVFGCGSAAL